MNKLVALVALLAMGLTACSAQVGGATAVTGKSGASTLEIPAPKDSVNRNKLKKHSGAEVEPEELATKPAKSPHEEAIGKLIRESKFHEIVKEIETAEKVDCMGLRVSQIHWMCLNGPTCGFSLDITCVSKIAQDTSNDQVLRLSFLGTSDSEKKTASFDNREPAKKRLKLEKAFDEI